MKTLKWQIAQWLELRWWKNYLRGKDKAAYLKWKKNYWANVLELTQGTCHAELVSASPQAGTETPKQVRGDTPRSIHPNQTVCDLGCGPAGIFIALAQNKVTAVDPLINEYENQISYFKREDYPNTSFVQSTMEEFTTTEKFDMVFCMNAINHVSNIEKAFDVLCSLPKKDGGVVLSIDAHNHSFFKWLFRLIPGDALHPHQYDLNEYADFLERRGLKVEERILLKKEFFFTHYVLVAR